MAGKSSFGTVRTLASGKFQARYMFDSRQRSAGTFDTARAAWKALSAVETDLDRGEFVDDSAGKVKFAEHARKVLEHRRGDLKDSTVRGYEVLLRTSLLPTFGSMALADITVETVDQWWSRHKDKPVNRRNAYFTLSMVLRYAVRWGHIKATPCVVENAGRDVAKPRPTFTVQDFKNVLAHAPLELGPVLWVIFGAHLRVAEACGLNLSDYQDGTLSVVRQYTDKGGRRELAPTKTGQHKRVTLLTPARLALEAHLEGNEGYSWDPMFRGPRGHRLNAAWVRQEWQKAREAAGLPDFHVHDLRHVSLTLVAQTGASLRQVQERGGHASVTAAMRYQHVSLEQDARVAALTDALL